MFRNAIATDVAGMVAMYPMVSIDTKRIERDNKEVNTEADAKTTHGIEVENKINLTK